MGMVLRSTIDVGINAVKTYLESKNETGLVPALKCIAHHCDVFVIEVSYHEPGIDLTQVCNGLAVKQFITPVSKSIFYVSKEPILVNAEEVYSKDTVFSEDGFRMNRNASVLHYVAKHVDHVVFKDEYVESAMNFWLLEHRVAALYQNEGYAVLESFENKALFVSKFTAHIPTAISTYCVSEHLQVEHPLLDDYLSKKSAA